MVCAAAVLAIAGAAIAVAASPDAINVPADASQTAVRIAPPYSTQLAGCGIFPNDNPWNMRVDGLSLRARSTQTIAAIQAAGSDNLHPDFGENQSYGIPYVVVPADQPLVPITYGSEGGPESDPGPFPIPLNAPVEAGSDAHVLVLQQGTCRLYELYAASRTATGWMAYSGASFDLRSNDLRPLGWTSADAAGLAILPGLVRFEEVQSGAINHAIRITMSSTQQAFILPATHFASANKNPDLPPMGLRLRLKGSYNVNQLSGQAKVIATAFQQYGVIVADNGSNWYFQGAPSPGWIDDDLNQLKSIPGTEFEVVETGPAIVT